MLPGQAAGVRKHFFISEHGSTEGPSVVHAVPLQPVDLDENAKSAMVAFYMPCFHSNFFGNLVVFFVLAAGFR